MAGFYPYPVQVPTSYNASMGIIVDTTPLFGSSTVIDAAPLRGSCNGILFEITEEGSNTFANKKFIVRPKYAMPPHKHTIDLENGSISNQPITKPAGNGACLAGGIVNGAGAATGITGIQDCAPGKLVEVTNGTNLQDLLGVSEITVGVIYD